VWHLGSGKQQKKRCQLGEKEHNLPEGLLKHAGPDSQTNSSVPEAWPCVTCHTPQAALKLSEAKGKD